jgi:hypothetical protein
MTIHERNDPPHWAHWGLVLCALLAIVVAAAGCGSQLRPVKTSSPPQANGAVARITVVGASVQVKSDAPTTRVSVSCPSGSQMIGGGFEATDVFEYDALVMASYPDPHDSSLRTWTAIAGPSSTFSLSVEAYCLNHGPALQISLHTLSGGQAAVCPGASALLGSGFNGETSYVLCAGQHASVSSGTPVTFNPHSSSHSYYPGAVTLTCPSNTLALSGDIIAGGDTMLASHSAGQPFTHWIMVLGGDYDVTASATCVNIGG